MKTLNYFMFDKLSIIIGIMMIALIGCTNADKKSSTDEQSAEPVEADLVAVEEDILIIDEHQINDIPITSMAKAPLSKPDISEDAEEENAEISDMEDEIEQEAEMLEEEEYEIASMEVMDAALAEQEYESVETVEVTEAIIPLDETQTLVSYNKKGEAKDMVQVISSGPDNEIEQIIFTHKKHQDVYNVQVGMSGKEIKQLRREMKHMIKHGKVFMYDDQSNIMYLMHAQNMEGDEITVADVENMDVQAIIWKDKKHHKKD